MKETFYFQHDYNARNDPKLQDVLIDLGAEGIGIFWCLVEQLYEQGGKMPLRSCRSIAFALHVDLSKVEAVVNNYGLFKNDGVDMWSESIMKRLNKRKCLSDKRKQSASARWRSAESTDQTDAIASNSHAIASNFDANAEQSHPQEHAIASSSDANAEQLHTQEDAIASNSDAIAPYKEKERKINIIEKEINKEREKHETAKRFVPPSLEEVKARIEEKGYSFDAESFIAFYQSKNWYVGRNKMRDWRAAMVTWQKRQDEFPRRNGRTGFISTKKANEEW